MLTFHVGFKHAGDAGLSVFAPGAHGTVTMPWALAVPARLDVAPGRHSPYVLTVSLDPVTFSLTAALIDLAARHYFRLADATVKLLPPTPPALVCQPGDAYLAVTPGAARLAEAAPGGASAAIARFVHLRDYFNAQKLAAALLEHLLELGQGTEPEGAGVLVVELR